LAALEVIITRSSPNAFFKMAASRFHCFFVLNFAFLVDISVLLYVPFNATLGKGAKM
jgi:hypothetical protein